MRITSIRAANIPPLTLFEVDKLSDVVVIAGRNGVGKTRLVQELVDFFQHPHDSQAARLRLTFEATTDDERVTWGRATLDSADGQQTIRLLQSLQQQRRRASWRSSVVQFESDRSINQLAPMPFDWNVTDPWEEIVAWTGTFWGLKSRFQDTMHSIFRKVRSHREAIARRAEELRNAGVSEMTLDWEDPLEAFKVAFRQLLGPKELADVDIQKQTLEFSVGGQTLPITALSSGEREVVNIVFDFLLRNPQDCVVIFDEPELHLHPELSSKLLQTLRTVGERNQFLFCTHSPEIITASLDQSVIFIGPPRLGNANQALPVRDDDSTNEALRLLGHSVGIIALGKRLVLIEGASTSLDKQVYGDVLSGRFPDLVLVPSGGKSVITSFAVLIREVLDRSIWGVEFFMVCDRDAVPNTVNASELENVSGGRLRVLRRYHLENYFLDAQTLTAVFHPLEAEASWLRDPLAVEAKLREIARTQLSYATALNVASHFRAVAGNLDIMPKGVQGLNGADIAKKLRDAADKELTRLQADVAPNDVAERARELYSRLENSLNAGTDEWKALVPGRPILNTFAATAGLSVGRLKTAYIRAAVVQAVSPFQEIIEIFEQFAAVAPRTPT